METAALVRLNSDSLRHYPTALPLLPAYSYLEYTAKDFPVASKYQNSIISLPMFPELNDEQIADIAGHVKDFYS